MNDKPKKNKGKKKSLVPAVRQKGTLVPQDPFNAYLHEAKNYPILTEEEEKELAIRLQETGDVDAAYKLTTANLMLVVKIAMTFKREWQNVMDLVQEGNVGLMKAVKNFDPFRGVRLSAYATWWIKSYILKYILDNWRLVRVGTTNARRKLLFNLKKEKERLERQGFDPSTKLLAEHFGVDEGEIIDVEASIGAIDVSMDTPTRADSTMTPAQSLSDGKSLEKGAEIDQFRKILSKKIEGFKSELNSGEIEILEKRILSESPQSLQEIGDQRGVTREAVRQAEQRLLKKFKIYIEEEMPEAADYFKN